MPFEIAQQHAGLHIPDIGGIVRTPRDQPRPIRTEAYAHYPAFLSPEIAENRSGFGIPDRRRRRVRHRQIRPRVITCRNDPRPVRTERQAVYMNPWSLEVEQRAPACASQITALSIREREN